MSSWAATEIVQKHIADIIPYERNPRNHPESQIDKLANSISQWGFTVPILIDEEGTVIAGHGRLYAAQKLGFDLVPAIITEGWTEEQKRAYVIADNKLQEGSDWNLQVMASELRDLLDVGFDINLAGVSETEFHVFSGTESSNEFKFDYQPKLLSDEIEAAPRKKTDEGFVEFALVMREESKIMLLSKLNEIKELHQLESNEDALMVLVASYDQNP